MSNLFQLKIPNFEISTPKSPLFITINYNANEFSYSSSLNHAIKMENRVSDRQTDNSSFLNEESKSKKRNPLKKHHPSNKKNKNS